MKNLTLPVICVLMLSTVAAQNYKISKYSNLVRKADSLYTAKDFKASAFTYSAAFKANNWKGTISERYNAACSWALANCTDSAFENLNQIATKEGYYSYDHITKDPDLASLRNDSRWVSLLKIVKANQEKTEANFNRPLVAELKDIFEKDQSCRPKLDSVSKKFGYDSKQMKDLWDDIGKKDSINLIKTEEILDKYGWLGPDIIGSNGTTTIFIVIQHSDQKTQEKYLPLMRDAVKKGKALASQLALLEDRVALEEGKKQIYGSQIGRDPKTGKYYVNPIENEVDVDKRRAAVGLEPLEVYVRNWGINYKLPAQ